MTVIVNGYWDSIVWRLCEDDCVGSSLRLLILVNLRLLQMFKFQMTGLRSYRVKTYLMIVDSRS